MSILDVRYQLLAQRSLQCAVQADRIPHAYLFHGPDGVGKMRMARSFARLLMCQNRTTVRPATPEYADHGTDWVDGCGTCVACGLHGADSHPDCHVVHRLLARYHTDERVRARKAMDLGIDVIRQFVIEPASRTAQMRGVKVFIIEDADRLTVPAQNALLKTLEEPPVGTTLILISRGLDAMLETTRSRCQLVRFGGLPAPFIADQVHATAPDLDPKAAGFLSRHASGSLGTAVRLAEDGVVETNAVVVKALASLRRFDALDVAKMVLDQADELAKVIKSRQPDSSDSDLKRQALICLLSLVATFYRDVLHLACAPDASITNDAQRQSVVAVAGQGGAERARVAIDDIVRAEADLQVNANSTLAIERLCIHLARKAPCAAI